MGVDHLVYAVPELDGAIDELERTIGVRAVWGGRHVGLGTHNALMALGRATYQEMIAPDPGQPATGSRRPFGLDTTDEPRLAGWAVACDGIEAAITRARQRGYDPGDPIAMERATPDGDVLRWKLT